MKIRYGFLIVFLVALDACLAEVTGPLSALKNEWGKGCPMDFRKKVYKTVPAVLKNGGTAEMIEWYQEIASYPDLIDALGATSWMHEKVETLLRYASSSPVSTSTNCWFAAAGFLSRCHQMVSMAESNANVKVDISLAKTDPKQFNEIFYGRKFLMKKAWNLKCVEQTLARVVTNEFPKRVLPSLPESERGKVMSEVLARAGLAKVGKEPGPVASGASPCRYVMICALSPLLLVGCGMMIWRRRSGSAACS